ncbi:MAG: TraB/GumN family protein, partial [Candidatus Methylomirabilales bacterium]
MFPTQRRVTRSCRQLLVVITLGLSATYIASACGSAREVAPPSAATASPAAPAPQTAGVTSVSPTPTPTAVSPSSLPEQRKVFLWTISSPTATVHLLGSVHVASQDVYPLDPKIESAFDRADTLVLEMPMDDASQLQAAQKLASAGTYPVGDSIDTHLNSEVFDLLQRQLTRRGASLDRVRSFRPWLVAVMLTLDEMQRLGYRTDLGIDIYFAEKANNRKRFLALETVDEQVALFAGMTEGVQEVMLKETLTKLGDVGEDMKRAHFFWRTGDTKAMDELLVAPLRKDYPDLYQSLFVERNRKMTAAIEGYLKATGEYFVV